MLTLDDTEAWTSDNPNAERQLWAAVIMQAIDDATGRSTIDHPRQRERAKAEARAWLLEPNEDFDEACALAGLEPDRIRAMITKLIAHDPENPPIGPRVITITYKGKTQTVTQWSKETGISTANIYARLKSNVSKDKLFAPVNERKPHSRKAA